MKQPSPTKKAHMRYLDEKPQSFVAGLLEGMSSPCLLFDDDREQPNYDELYEKDFKKHVAFYWQDCLGFLRKNQRTLASLSKHSSLR